MIRIESVAAFVVWPVRQEVMYPEKDIDFVKLPGDQDAVHLALYDEDVLVSVISLFEDDHELQFRKFATIAEHQGKGYGSQLLEYVLSYAQQKDFKRIWCNARIRAATFYKRFGFAETKERFSKHGMDYVVLELVLT